MSEAEKVLESFPFPVWRSGCDARRDYVNRGWLDFTGRTLPQEVGDGWSAGIHPDDLDAVLRSYQKAFHVRALFEAEYRLRRHDGEYRWVVDSGAPFEDAGGNFAGYIGGCYDITQLKKTEGQWEEAELLANLGSWEWDILTGALTWSDELYRVLGLDKKAFCPTHQTFHDLLHPHDRELFKVALDDCLKGRRPYDFELRIVRPNGTVRTVQSRGRAIFDETGKPLRMNGTAQDITERKRSEERIRELGAIVESSDDAILGKSLDGIITSWNKGAEKIYGYAENEVIGQPISMLVPTDRSDEAPQILGRLARGETIDHYETVRRRKDRQEIHVSLTISPIRNLAGRIIGASSVARDVTERRRLEMQLRQAQKMEAIGLLAAGVAHDFNNLLSVISGHSELLAMLAPLNDRWRDSISEIRRATELGSASIRQLLAFSCRQVVEPKVLDLNTVVAEAEKMLRKLIGEDVHLATLLQPRISPVRGDLVQLNQVLLNLAVNSRDAMPQGGSLTLETREVDLDPADVKARPEVSPGRYVLLTVTDTGCGMTPDVQARIFEPFFTTKGEGHGTGLGLAVALGIIRQSEGHIDVESRPEVGTKFKIYLPAVQGLAEGSAQSPSSKLVGGSETVLLVEDEEQVRNITILLLETLGYRVLEAESGQEALRLFGASREKIDLLITDVVMPDLSGREVAEALRARDPGLRVLFQSGYTDDTVIRWGVSHAEVAFLKSPSRSTFWPERFARCWIGLHPDPIRTSDLVDRF